MSKLTPTQSNELPELLAGLGGQALSLQRQACALRRLMEIAPGETVLSVADVAALLLPLEAQLTSLVGDLGGAVDLASS